MRNIINGIKNIWYWLPVIWKWRPWDYVFLLQVMIHALKDMENCHRNASHYVGAEKIAKNIAIARRCLEILLEEDGTKYMDLVDDPKGILGLSWKIKQNSPFGTKKAIFDNERQIRKEAIALFCKKFYNVEKWWD